MALARAPAALRVADGRVDQRQGDVVGEAHARQQVEALEDEADGAVAQPRRVSSLSSAATSLPASK
jgi:hypothetical protein